MDDQARYPLVANQQIRAAAQDADRQILFAAMPHQCLQLLNGSRLGKILRSPAQTKPGVRCQRFLFANNMLKSAQKTHLKHPLRVPRNAVISS